VAVTAAVTAVRAIRAGTTERERMIPSSAVGGRTGKKAGDAAGACNPEHLSGHSWV
jgi:hypothetical protein